MRSSCRSIGALSLPSVSTRYVLCTLYGAHWGLTQTQARVGGKQNKLSTQLSLIADVMREADHWARKESATVVAERCAFRDVGSYSTQTPRV